MIVFQGEDAGPLLPENKLAELLQEAREVLARHEHRYDALCELEARYREMLLPPDLCFAAAHRMLQYVERENADR